jgi:large subunit ribosomal protein L14e
MSGLALGSVCIKTAGRKTGEKVVVLELDKEKHLATVIGENVKKKKCNLRHLFPTGKTVKLGKGVSQKQVEKLLKE